MGIFWKNDDAWYVRLLAGIVQAWKRLWPFAFVLVMVGGCIAPQFHLHVGEKHYHEPAVVTESEQKTADEPEYKWEITL